MSTTWLVPGLELVLVLLLLPLGNCQGGLSLNAAAKSDALDVFATAAQLATAIDAHTNHESRVNNITLTDAEEMDPLEPHAASLRPLSQRKLSRGKRFVAFPLGSSASVSEQQTKHTTHRTQHTEHSTTHADNSIRVSA